MNFQAAFGPSVLLRGAFQSHGLQCAVMTRRYMAFCLFWCAILTARLFASDPSPAPENLHPEEAQHLAILANTMNDLLAVTERLGWVQGQIEQLQAEFNALSRPIETVATRVSLSTDAEEKVFGLNWGSGYRWQLGLRDGVEGLATDAMALTTILFYRPGGPTTVGWNQSDWNRYGMESHELGGATAVWLDRSATAGVRVSSPLGQLL